LDGKLHGLWFSSGRLPDTLRKHAAKSPEFE
jgi:hypothetical protein